MIKKQPEHWTCPHGFVTGFFPVPGQPNLIEHRSCGFCCDEISNLINLADGVSVPEKDAGK